MEQWVYLGPGIATGALSLPHGTIFRGTLPPAVAERQVLDADFAALLVVPERVARARADLKAGGTFLSSCYARVLADHGKEA